MTTKEAGGGVKKHRRPYGMVSPIRSTADVNGSFGTKEDEREGACDFNFYIIKISNALSSKPVNGAALTLESVHDIERSDGLTTSVLTVSDRISNNVLKESLQDSTDLIVDVVSDTLDTTTTSKTANSRLGNTLNVVTSDHTILFDHRVTCSIEKS